jgi:beta-lactamase regulating signal transducer with metallopeptidase domain
VIASLLDHLWQSTLFAGGMGLLTLVFRRNGAGVRFWLWFAASLKFLVPFAALAALGEYLFRLFPAALPPSLLAIQPAAEKLSAPAQMLVAGQSPDLAPLLLTVWAMGMVALLGLRLVRALRLRAVIAASHDLTLPAPVRVKASPSLLEPGLVGIVRPVVLLPAQLMARLSQPERDAILAHELGHLSRGDNVTAAIHMAVEALFWFYPPVWLIGERLIAERERACDESVLASGHDPEIYAGSILKVCKFCVQSPLACAPGASGADLKGRVRQIMTGEAVLGLTAGKRLLLTGAAMLALGLPVMAGFLDSPLVVPMAMEMQRKVAAVSSQVTASVTRHVAAVEQQIGITPVQIQARRLPHLKVAIATAAPLPLPQPDPAPAQAAAQAEPAPPAPAPAAAEVQPVSTPAPSLKEVAMALDPRGAGDPDAITCRVPQQLPGSRLPGPEVCKANRIWAELRARHEEISPDGLQVIVMGASERFKTASSATCPFAPRVSGASYALLYVPAYFCF